MAREAARNGDRKEIVALKVHQWLKEWKGVPFNATKHRREPARHFYVFSLRASELMALSGIQRRTVEGNLPRSEDTGIQRWHDKERSQKIGNYVVFGYPWSDLSERQRTSGSYADLRMPGWLPTAIVVNILQQADKRHGLRVSDEDAIEVDDGEREDATAKITLPCNYKGPIKGSLPPLEIIDGQHRLYAFEGALQDSDFELPVVAFKSLDISFQAYLFYTINIKPKRINISLAYDMYPLLRTEDWLEKFEGPSIYRETRAQEIVSLLWIHPKSPWRGWINMLGEPGQTKAMATQAAWIRSLLATYIKKWDSPSTRIGGLFGAPTGKDQLALPWSRFEQTAFLIMVGQKVKDAIRACLEPWTRSLRNEDEQMPLGFEDWDMAFYSSHSLLSTDQGIRGLLSVTNDLCYLRADKLSLMSWKANLDSDAPEEVSIQQALGSLENTKVANFVGRIAKRLAEYDWRTSSAPGLKEEEKGVKAGFRGSGGYRLLRESLLKHLAREDGDVGQTAEEAIRTLGY